MNPDSAAVYVYPNNIPPEIQKKYLEKGIFPAHDVRIMLGVAAANYAKGHHYDTRIDASDLKAIIAAGREPLRRFRAAKTRQLKRHKAHAQKPTHNRNWRLK